MRTIKNINKDWLFAPEELDPNTSDDAFISITLPHTNKLFSQRYVDNHDYQFISTYRKYLTIPEDAIGKRITIQFDGVMLMSTVYINDQLLGVHKGGYTPFTFDITDHVTAGENTLTVYVDSTERDDIPPYGELVDYLTFGGIYRDVTLQILDPCHIATAFAKPINVLTSPTLDCDIELSQVVDGLQLTMNLEDTQGQLVAQQIHDVTTKTFTVSMAELDSIQLWSLDNPVLYQLSLELSSENCVLDTDVVRLGFRSAEFSDDGQFYLNGNPLKLRGLNRHQTYPYIGAAAPKRLQELDAEILKHELGCNIVRTSHYAQSPHFLTRCDEIGLLVFEELAGWQHIGDEAWRGLVMQDLRAMIERDRHHPSIILWGVRVNESPDHEAFYTGTNALAHQLDPTRQTGGVRNFHTSQFLEDVFTLNDFTEGIQEPRVPHLITEFGGHMFPTKTWDHEARRVEHALKHARKHNLQYGHPDVAGAIGWCAFDYHTHQHFGSGDRICHHGVMDIFRLPKMAAYFYRSQKSPDDEVVLYPATHWTIGDRDGGGNNPLVVFSNLDRIEIWIGDELQKCLEPDRETYPHLPHAPFVLQWEEPYNPWGTASLDLRVVGFMGDKPVTEHIIAADHRPHRLQLHCHTTDLYADGQDMARIAVTIVDKHGNVLPYQLPVITWTVQGDATLIGENPMSLIGGQGACFIRAGQTTGKVQITVETPMLEAVTIELGILPE